MSNQVKPTIKRLTAKLISISVQGDKVFAICRYPHQQTVENGKIVNKKGAIVGNIAGLPEEELTLAEIQLDTDIDPTISTVDAEKLIGRDVKVEFLGKHPVRVITRLDQQNSRRISKEDIWSARNLSPNKSLKTKEAKDYLLNKGYEKTIVDAVINETFEKVNPEGKELTFGNRVSWDSVSKKKGAVDALTHVDSKAVINIPQDEFTQKCFSPVKAISGKF